MSQKITTSTWPRTPTRTCTKTAGVAIFIDTSGIYAVLDGGDLRHPAAVQFWTELIGSGEELVSSSYVVVEIFALVQRRLGMSTVRAYAANVLPALRVEWVDRTLHEVGVAIWLTADRRQ